ncbi:YbhB/YbcL family Raf kinase inhibitor-like protein [Actinoplanes sp. NPDC049681]|uniref:YbhB/YbcL family Raf kinase inhibitor-like protein n=1 Tax=Actinoplanes sp. NPDC049681 TaxID=3363905 RepID=UPI00378EB078
MDHDPYAKAFPVPAFPLASTDFAPGGPLPPSACATVDGPGESPALSWGPLPQAARSVVVTAFDADAPIPGGLWHWVVKDIPASVGGLPRGAADRLPAGACHLANDLGRAAYSGAKPPPGTGTHRMFLAVTALDVEVLEVPAGASLAMLHILMVPHTVGRGVLVGTSVAP